MKTRALSISLLFILSIMVLWCICPVIARNLAMGISRLTSKDGTQRPRLTLHLKLLHPLHPRRNCQILHHIGKPTGLGSVYAYLEVDLPNPVVMVRPVTSHKPYLAISSAEMSEEWQAEAAVNAGFSYSNGLWEAFLHDQKLYSCLKLSRHIC